MRSSACKTLLRESRVRIGYIAAGIIGLAAVAASPASAQRASTTPGADSFALPALEAPAPIPPQEYAARRAALAEGMEDGVFVALGAVEPELDYLPYAQKADFRYLTGIVEAGASLVMVKADGRVEETLFVRARDPSQELWEGERLGTEGASSRTGMAARTADGLIPALDSLLATHPRLYVVASGPTAADDVLTRDQQLLSSVLQSKPTTEVVTLTPELEQLRARKSETELDYIRRAVQITTLALREAMKSLAPGMNEFEIHGLIEYFFRRNGAERPAFGSIVGSGPNTTTLHYRDADRFMEPDELLLMDVGASYRGYAADITRTIPVDGSFDPDQLAVYEIVLEAQKAAEQRLRPGLTWNDPNAAANLVIATGLAELGLIDAPDATYSCEQPQTGNRCSQLRLFYMHSLGHGVGLEVHDPDVSYFGPFEVGSVFTLEPGIYVRADALDYLPDTPENRAMIDRLRPALERYAGIGVRIEDDYIVTDTGFDRLSAGVPREASEIEALMREEGAGQLLRQPEIVEWYRATEPE